MDTYTSMRYRYLTGTCQCGNPTGMKGSRFTIKTCYPCIYDDTISFVRCVGCGMDHSMLNFNGCCEDCMALDARGKECTISGRKFVCMCNTKYSEGSMEPRDYPICRGCEIETFTPTPKPAISRG